MLTPCGGIADVSPDLRGSHGCRLDPGCDGAVSRLQPRPQRAAARRHRGPVGGRPERLQARVAPIQAGQRWHVERTNAWHNSFNRLQRCYERREEVIDAFFDLADAIIIVRSLIRQAWTTYRWDTRPAHRR